MATRSGASVTIVVEGVALDSTAGINGATSSIARRYIHSWAAGTSAGQADLVTAIALSVGTTPVDYDLAGGSNVVDPSSGDAQTYTRLHAVIVHNTHATQTLTVGGDANSVPIFDAAADSVTIAAGQSRVLYLAAAGSDGVAVTAGTGDILQVVGSAASTTGQLILIGR